MGFYPSESEFSSATEGALDVALEGVAEGADEVALCCRILLDVLEGGAPRGFLALLAFGVFVGATQVSRQSKCHKWVDLPVSTLSFTFFGAGPAVSSASAAGLFNFEELASLWTAGVSFASDLEEPALVAGFFRYSGFGDFFWKLGMSFTSG